MLSQVASIHIHDIVTALYQVVSCMRGRQVASENGNGDLARGRDEQNREQSRGAGAEAADERCVARALFRMTLTGLLRDTPRHCKGRSKCSINTINLELNIGRP